jgi:hypothetical protein
MKDQKVNKLTSKKENQERFEEKRLEGFRHFISANLKEIYCEECINKLLKKPILS